MLVSSFSTLLVYLVLLRKSRDFCEAIVTDKMSLAVDFENVSGHAGPGGVVISWFDSWSISPGRVDVVGFSPGVFEG
jgi:hypothetical protein